jgi:murein DD-endopeptidase MepM/ murein hydrolase activator NlpD
MLAPTKGRITSKYGERTHPITKAKSFHNGVDVAAPIGTDVISPANGVVTSTYNHLTGGLTMIIAHDNGLESRMAHLSEFVAKTGDRVREGQLVAKVGNTGRSTGPHLHYGMRDHRRQYVDPMEHIREWR